MSIVDCASKRIAHTCQLTSEVIAIAELEWGSSGANIIEETLLPEEPAPRIIIVCHGAYAICHRRPIARGVIREVNLKAKGCSPALLGISDLAYQVPVVVDKVLDCSSRICNALNRVVRVVTIRGYFTDILFRYMRCEESAMTIIEHRSRLGRPARALLLNSASKAPARIRFSSCMRLS